ncbi:MAG TPA: PTS sugar transporter subunit IIA [Pirellulales bacterium]|nr:PTS sugar transporter subunit IIA [Pirellulales bacterium]
MADDDFDIETLAVYLHLAPPQVARLTDRGKLPGRKVQGVWRFSQAEIHHWLEDRIGLSDEEGLTELEGFLRPAVTTDEALPSIADLLPVEAMVVPLGARTRGSVVKEMVDAAARTGLVWDPARMTEAVQAREELHSTALENGVALLHPRRPLASILGGPVLAFGRTDRGIPFGGSVTTDLFFLICSVEDRGHLQTLARLSRLVGNASFLADLRAAADARTVHELIERAEAGLRESG